MRILVIAPHHDDEVLGVGGTIARHVAEGDRVCVCTVTEGLESQFGAVGVAQVRREAQEAHQVLGIDCAVELKLPAVHLDRVPQCELNDMLAAETADADIVYLPSPVDVNDDHRRVFEAGLVACRPRFESHVHTVLCYETLSETEWGASNSQRSFVPNWYVDITPFLETKLAALRCYGSQLQPSPAARSLDTVNALAVFRGHTIGVNYAEAFTLVRHTSLPFRATTDATVPGGNG